MIKKRGISIYILILILIILTGSVLADLDCTIEQGSCSSGTKIFAMNNYTNAHAELATQSNYNYYVCCEDNSSTYAVDTACGTKVLGLSNYTNAHAERGTFDSVDYPEDVCMNSSVDITCSYGASCSASETCVATLGAVNESDPGKNAHVASCDNEPYTEKVCCSFNGCIDNDGDGWGAEGSDLYQCTYTGSTDCNDSNTNINPDAYDTPNNGVDEDCSGADATANYNASITFELDYNVDGFWGYHIGDDIGYAN